MLVRIGLESQIIFRPARIYSRQQPCLSKSEVALPVFFWIDMRWKRPLDLGPWGYVVCSLVFYVGVSSLMIEIIAVMAVGFIMGIIGVIAFAIETDKGDWYSFLFLEPTSCQRLKTTCEIIGHDIYVDTCREKRCTGSSDNRRCRYYYETCYQYSWLVEYELVDDKRTGSNETVVGDRTYRQGSIYGGSADTQSSAQNSLNSRPVGSMHDCYYDPNGSGLQFNPPDTTFGIVFMCIGFPLLFIGGMVWIALVVIDALN